MDQIKTLTVNGKTYEIADPDAAHIDDTTVGEQAWSAKNIIDRLCPAFSETGPVVTCQPAEGYPLGVTSHISAQWDSATLWHHGKNLCNENSFRPESIVFDEATGLWTVVYDSGGYYKSLFTTENGSEGDRDVTKIIKVAPNTTYTIRINDWSVTALNNVTLSEYDTYLSLGMINTEGKHVKSITLNGASCFVDGGYTYAFTTVSDCDYLDIRRAHRNYQVSFSSLQIERGDAYTGYEPYQGAKYAVNFGKTVQSGSYDWQSGVLTDEAGEQTQLTPQPVLALSGVNTLYCDTGDTAVTGRADLPALLEALTAGQ